MTCRSSYRATLVSLSLTWQRCRSGRLRGQFSMHCCLAKPGIWNRPTYQEKNYCTRESACERVDRCRRVREVHEMFPLVELRTTWRPVNQASWDIFTSGQASCKPNLPGSLRRLLEGRGEREYI